MDRRFALYAFLIAPLLLIIASGASAMSCDKDTLSFRVDAGNWAYGEIKCSDAQGLEGDYTGNLSEKTRILVDIDGDIYTVGMLTDARNLDQGTYRGKISLTDDKGDDLKITTRLSIGDGTDEQITLSKTGVSFEIDQANRTECYTIDINNSGNVNLYNLKAEFTTADLNFITNNNASHRNWAEISKIEDTDLKAGKVKHLEICVNTYTDHLDLKNRETTIAVTADGSRTGSIREEITVSLQCSWDSEWKKKYDTLNEQHQFLEKAYSRERAYRSAYEELNKTYSDLLYNYTAYFGNYRYSTPNKTNSPTDATIPETYESLHKKLLSLDANYSRLLNQTRQTGNITQNNSGSGNQSASELENIKRDLEDARSQIEEKDATLTLMSLKKNSCNITGNQTMLAGYSVLIPPQYASYIPMVLIAILLVAAVFLLIRKYAQRNRKKEVILKLPAIRTEAEEQKIEETEKQNAPNQEALRLKEQQKDALRQLLLAKLAEEAGEKK